MSKKMNELQQELIIAIDQLQILIDGQRSTKTYNELNVLAEFKSVPLGDPLQFLKNCSEALKNMRGSILKKPPSLNQSDVEYLCNYLKYVKNYFDSTHRPLFNSFILMIRAFFRIIDVTLTLGHTWNETGRTPFANALVGRDQFFSLSETETIIRAVNKFNKAKTKYEIELQKIDKTTLESQEVPVATIIEPTAPPKR